MRISILLISLIFSGSMTIYKFSKDSNSRDWYIVDDVVMGGRSNGNFTMNQEGYGRFYGRVSLENNGGFSSVRYEFKPVSTSDYSKFVIRVKGDGKSYQFRAKSSPREYASYVYKFQTTGDWMTIEIPFSEMYPSFRGRKLRQPNYQGESLSEIAFLIGNKKAEDFELLIDSISLE